MHLFFDKKGTWCHEVTAEVLTRMSASKQVAVDMFAAFEDHDKMKQTLSLAVCHPQDSKDKCADYHKHGEGYPRCS